MNKKSSTFGKRGVSKAVRQSRAKRATEVTLTKAEQYDAIKKPIITEKSMAEAENKKYTFEVKSTVAKPDIKAAIEEIYDVKIDSIKTINTKRKPKTVGRYKGYRSGYKKAIIKLAKDSKAIETFNM